MAFTVKVVSLTTTDTTIVQVSGSLEGVVHGLVFCNNYNYTLPLTVKLLDASQGTTSIIAELDVAANSQFTWPRPINLEPGDAVIGVGANLIALHSTYVGVNTPAAQGFTGRGNWSSVATYQINDVVSYQGSSYLANAVNINSTPPSADWTLLAQKGQDSGMLNVIRTPVAISPVTGGTNPPQNGPLVASAYAPIYSVDARDYREFQVTLPADTTFSTPVFSTQVNADSVVISPFLTGGTTYIWRCKDVSLSGEESPWMTTQTFITNSITVVTPTISAPATTNVVESPYIIANAYQTTPIQEGTHASTSWRVKLASTDAIIWSSLNDVENLTSIMVPPNILTTNTSYKFEVQYNSDLYGSSAWATLTGTTAATFVDSLSSSLNSVDLGTNVQGFNTIAVISPTRIIYGYVRRQATPATATGSFLILGIADLVGDKFEKVAGSEVVAKTDVFVNNVVAQGMFAIEMLTPTLGAITYTNTGASQNIVATGFTLSGTTFTFGSTVTIFATTTGIQHQLVRMTDTTALFMVAPSGQVQTCVLTYSGPTPVFNTPINSGLADDENVYKYRVVRLTDTLFAYAGRAASAGSYSVFIRVGSISGSGSGAAITLGTAISVTGQTQGVFPQIANLEDVNAILVGLDSNSTTNDNGSIRLYSRAGTTLTLVQTQTSIGNFFSTPSSIDSSSMSCFAPFNTGQLLFTRTTTAASIISYSSLGFAVSPIATTIPTVPTGARSLLRLIAPGGTNTTTTASFISVCSAGNGLSANKIDVVNGAISANSGYSVFLSQAPFATFGLSSSTLDSLKTTRAVITYSAFGPQYNSSGNECIYVRLIDIAQTTPTLVAEYPIQANGIGLNNTYAVRALSYNRILVVYYTQTAGSTAVAKLFAITDTSFTELSSINLPTTTSGGQGLDISRISATSAIVSYITSSSSILGVVLTTTGDVLSIASQNALTLLTTATKLSTGMLTATRGVLAFCTTANTTLHTLFDTTSNNLTAVQLDTGSIASGQQRPSIAPIDATTAIEYYQTSTATTSAIRKITMSGNTLSFSAAATLASGGSAAAQNGRQSVVAQIDPTRGVFLVYYTNIRIYSYTTATPTIGASLQTVISTLPANAALNAVPVENPSTGAVNSDYIVLGVSNTSTGQDSYYNFYRFLRGA